MIRNFYILINCVYIYLSENFNYLFNFSKQKYNTNIINRLSKLDILFIKILQWVSNNENDEINQLLMDYSNNVNYEEDDIDYNLLKKLEESHNVTIDNNYKPINSGSIALVFKGTFKNNKIIIKTKRKDIEEKIKQSINLINFLSSTINFIPSFFKNNISTIIKENTNNLLKQIDFNNEKNNLNIFYEIFKDDKKIFTPYIYNELSNNDVIVMEHLDGVSIHDFLNKEDSDKKIFKYVYDFFLTSIIEHNIIHSDLHKGNVLFLKENNSIGVIDFGLIKFLTNNQKIILIQYLQGIFSKFEIFKNIILTKILEKIDKNKETDFDKVKKNSKFNALVKEIVGGAGVLQFLHIEPEIKKYNLRIKKDLFDILIDVGPFVDLCHFMSNKLGKNISRQAVTSYKKKIINQQFK